MNYTKIHLMIDKFQRKINVLISGTLIGFLMVAETTLAAGDGSLDSTVEINSSTTNGPILSNDDNFGISVAGIGDLDGDGVADFIIGASGDDYGGSGRGAAHILFMNTDGSVKSTTEINSGTTNGPSLADYDNFGSSVEGIGDLDGDGVEDVAIGARWDDNGGNARGAVHILFMNTDGSVKSTTEINSSTTNGPILANSDYFGSSVANIGDLDGDGVQDLAVGAKGDDNGGVKRGAVHILFMNTDGSVKSTTEINSGTTNGPSLSDYDGIGKTIANIGDLDGDGINDIATNLSGWYANNGDPGTYRGGIAIMFMNTDGSVKSTVEINDGTDNGPVLNNYDYFGYSITSAGDLNEDGVSDIVATAFGDDSGGTNRGAAYILFMDTDGSVKSTVEINNSTTNGPVLSDGDYFGSSVANIGDLDGNGINDLIIGAPWDDNGGSNRGAVHIIFLAEEVTSSGGGMSIKDIKPMEPSIFTKVIDSTTIYVSESHNSPNIFTNKIGFTYKTDDKEETVSINMGRAYSNSKFSRYLRDMQCDTEYEIQAFAENGRGTVYSEVQNVTTEECDNDNSNTDTEKEDDSSDELEFAYSNPLKSGDENSNVKRLQILLNSFGFFVATEGPGSKGLETNFYGSLTASAVSRLQSALNLTVTGQVDSETLQIINILQIIKDMGL